MRIKLMTLCMALCCLCLNATSQNVPDYVPTDGLVAWWPMNGNVDDAIGSLDGFNQGGVETDGPDGQIGQAMELPNGDDYIDLPTGGVSEEGGLTLTFWAWLELPAEGAAPLIDRIEVDNNLWSFSYEHSTETVHFITRNNDGSGYHNLSTWSPPPAEWVHVTSVYRATSGLKELHVNGSLVGAELAPLEGFTMPTMRLGEVAEGIWNSNCRFSGVGIWNRSLTEEEILVLYNAQLPVPGCTDVSACNFSEEASEDNGSCIYPLFGDDCEDGGAACGEGTTWDSSLQSCVGFDQCPSDLDDDGIVGINDLLSLLSDFGTECPPEVAEWICGDLLNYHGYDYATVQVGDQCWFAENLRTELYASGDPIPSDIQDSLLWATAGAQTYFLEDSVYLEERGRMYNGHAVLDARGLCPTGWHVPSDGDFIQLEGATGMSEVDWESTEGDRGCSLEIGETWKSQTGWYPGEEGTDLWGLSVQPSGYFLTWEGFGNAYTSSEFWTSTPYDATRLWRRQVPADSGCLFRGWWELSVGSAVRCIKDTEE